MNENKAALKIQKTFRGYISRKLNKKPAIDLKQSYPTILNGNDGEITIPVQDKRNDSKFTFVGCSGIRSLFIIMELVNFNKLKKSKDGIENIPKLFIIDNSKEVYDLWMLIKKCMNSSPSLKDLQYNIAKSSSDIKSCCREIPGKDASYELYFWIDFLCKKDQFKYDFIRNIVQNSQILNHDWSKSNPFEFIKKHTNTPIYVYPSNIVEYVAAFVDKDLANDVVENICSLNPEMTFHTRTLKEEDGMYPKGVVISKAKQKNKQLIDLSAPKFKKLDHDYYNEDTHNQNKKVEDLFQGFINFLLSGNATNYTPSKSIDSETFCTQNSDKEEGVMGFKKGFLMCETSSSNTVEKKTLAKKETDSKKTSTKEDSWFKPGFLNCKSNASNSIDKQILSIKTMPVEKKATTNKEGGCKKEPVKKLGYGGLQGGFFN